MGKKKVSFFSVLVFIVALLGLGVGVYSLYNYQQLVSQIESPKPLTRAFVVTSYSMLDTVWEKIDFDALDYDVNGDFNLITDRFTCPTGGYYLISVMLTFSDMLDGETIRVGVFSEAVFEARSVAHASHATDLSVGFTDIVFLNAGEYIEFGAYHTGAGQRSIFGDSIGTYTYITIAFLN